MKSWKVALILAVISLLLAFALAAAQESVRSFDQLDTRLKPGDTVWVTDAHGREVKGKVASVTSEAVALKGRGAPVFRASDVRVVRRRAPGRRTWNGAAVGALAGLGAGIAACAAYPKDDPLRCDACMMAVGLSWMPGFGAGALVGAMFPGRRQVVYRAPGIAAPLSRPLLPLLVRVRARRPDRPVRARCARGRGRRGAGGRSGSGCPEPEILPKN